MRYDGAGSEMTDGRGNNEGQDEDERALLTEAKEEVARLRAEGLHEEADEMQEMVNEMEADRAALAMEQGDASSSSPPPQRLGEAGVDQAANASC